MSSRIFSPIFFPPEVPQFILCILKAFRYKVNRLVGLVLVRLYRRLLWVERLVLGLVWQGVLWGGKEVESNVSTASECCRLVCYKIKKRHSQRALRTTRGDLHRKLSLLHSACRGQTPRWTSITAEEGNQKCFTFKRGVWPLDGSRSSSISYRWKFLNLLIGSSKWGESNLLVPSKKTDCERWCKQKKTTAACVTPDENIWENSPGKTEQIPYLPAWGCVRATRGSNPCQGRLSWVRRRVNRHRRINWKN